nr:hypothetical protein [Tanacetum cinerariifolium]
MFSNEWSIASPPNCVDTNPNYLTPWMIQLWFETPSSMNDLQIHTASLKNKDHPNACHVYMLYCLANQREFNLAYYIAKRMASVIKREFMVLHYAMLITCLYRHVLSIHPYLTPNIYILVDHVMVPLTEGQTNRIMVDGKRPHSQTSFGSSPSPSPTPNQEENELVDNYTLDPVVYINQLPPIAEGESPEFKQRTVPSAAKVGSFVQMESSLPVLEKAFLCFRALVYSTPPSSPIEPYPYLNSLEDLPPRSTNPPPLSLDQANNQTLSHTTLMDFEPPFPPINLFRRGN